MTDEQHLEDPTNRIVSVLDTPGHAAAVRRDLIEHGFLDSQIRVFHGSEAADNVDTSNKWFADTDQEIERYEQALRAGQTVLSVPVSDAKSRETAHQVLKQHDARLVTHFGDWVTEMLE